MIQTIGELEKIITHLTQEEQKLVVRAAKLSEKLHEGQLRESGEPYFVHPLQVAEVLAEMRLDGATICGALLHDVLEDTSLTRQDLRRDFGKEVELLVNGVTKIALVKSKNKNVQESATIRKMLFAMVKDIRVILIKLADKLHNMRTLGYKKADRQRSIAQETLDIYAPLAGRLGISWMKDELEDLSLKHLNNEMYQEIRRYVADKKGERAAYLERVKEAIYQAAEEEDLSVVVETRAKHFYSIYQKMKRFGKSLDEIYDLLGIRILCDNENECYNVLGLVHRLWPPMEGRFKDYIAMPKANQYQSLHTTVLSFDGKTLEIQIRTKRMHQTAEYGVAAHWIYKRGGSRDQVKREDLAIISRVRDLNGARITSSEFLEEIKREILKDSIYVFTPKGDAIELPKGATAIDFAYHIHTEVGSHTAGAKADGSIIPLKEPLKNTQVVEVMTNPNARPHLNWLRYARTSRARQKIRHWLNKHDENLIINRSIVARRKPAAPKEPPPTQVKEKEAEHTGKLMDEHKVAVRVGDERNMMIRFAKCCTPSTGDDIIGYISRGRGIIIHRRDCPNLKFIDDLDERKIEVEWETVSPRTTKRFRVTAQKTNDLFSEIEGAVRKYQGHLIEGRIDENDQGKLEGFFTMELERQADVKRVMKSIRAIPHVTNLSETAARSA